MSRKTKMVLALAGCLVILAAFAMLMIQTIDQKILSEAEMKKMIAKDYNGNITHIDLINHKQDYTMTLENANGIYQIIASSASGQMKEIRQLKSYQKPNEKNAELQAEEAAVKKVSGTVIQKKRRQIVSFLPSNQKKNYIKSRSTNSHLRCLKQKRKNQPLKKRSLRKSLSRKPSKLPSKKLAEQWMMLILKHSAVCSYLRWSWICLTEERRRCL